MIGDEYWTVRFRSYGFVGCMDPVALLARVVSESPNGDVKMSELMGQRMCLHYTADQVKWFARTRTEAISQAVVLAEQRLAEEEYKLEKSNARLLQAVKGLAFVRGMRSENLGCAQ